MLEDFKTFLIELKVKIIFFNYSYGLHLQKNYRNNSRLLRNNRDQKKNKYYIISEIYIANIINIIRYLNKIKN